MHTRIIWSRYRSKTSKSRRNWIRVFVDTETYIELKGDPNKYGKHIDNLGETKPYLIGWTDDLYYFYPRGHIYISKNVKDFYEYLKELCTRYKTVELWMHNASYDFPIIADEFLKYATPIRYEVMKMTTDNHPFNGRYKDNNGVQFSIHCSLMWNRCQSLKGFADDYYPHLSNSEQIDYGKYNARWTERGLEYIDIDRRPLIADESNEVDYLIKDVKLTALYFQHIQNSRTDLQKVTHLTKQEIDNLLDKLGWDWETEGVISRRAVNKVFNNLSRSVTISSYGKNLLDIYLRIYLNRTYAELLTPPTADESLACYAPKSVLGGLTLYNKETQEVFYKAKHKTKIREYDINSAYPYAMQRDDFCYGQLQDSPDELQNPVKWYYFEVPNKSEWDTSITPTLSNSPWPRDRWGEILVQPAFYVDFINSLDRYKVKILKVVYSESGAILKEFINGLYERRQQAKLNKEISLGNSIKLLLNSLYGKTIEKPKASYKAFEYSEDINRYALIEKEQELSDASCSVPGIYITCYTRYTLLKAIIDEHARGNTFLYCDTDSLKIIERNPIGVKQHDTELGAWKLEGKPWAYRTNGRRKKYLLIYLKNGKDVPKFASSGISRSFAKKLKECPVDDLWDLFDPDYCPILRKAKTSHTFKHNKPIITTQPFYTFNSGKKPPKYLYRLDGGTNKIIKDPIKVIPEIQLIGEKYLAALKKLHG